MDDILKLVNAIGSAVNALAVIVLVGVTWWYAYSTRKILTQMQAQSASTERQAKATQAHLDLLQRSSLPEWDLRFSASPEEVRVEACNNGLSLARNIQVFLDPEPAGGKKCAVSVKEPLQTWVAQPGGHVTLLINSQEPPYEGNLVIRSNGRWNFPHEARWLIRVNREQHGHKMMIFDVLSKTNRTEKMTF